MRTFLIISPEGGLLFEAVGVADILVQANRLKPEGSKQSPYQVTVATTQPHRVVHGRSGLNLLADYRLTELDPGELRDTIMITGRGVSDEEDAAVA